MGTLCLHCTYILRVHDIAVRTYRRGDRDAHQFEVFPCLLQFRPWYRYISALTLWALRARYLVFSCSLPIVFVSFLGTGTFLSFWACYCSGDWGLIYGRPLERWRP